MAAGCHSRRPCSFAEVRQYFEEQIPDGGSDRCLADGCVLVAHRTGGAAQHGQVGVFGIILYNLLRVVILAILLVFVIRYGGYWLWRKLTGREA